MSRTETLVDADHVLPRLYIGSFSSQDKLELLRPRPNIVISAAKEVPPEMADGLITKHIPLVDTDIDWKRTPKTWNAVMATGRYIAERYMQGDTILVICYGGINRSSLIVGVALRYLGFTGPQALQQIQNTRGSTGIVLTRPCFRNAILYMTPSVVLPYTKIKSHQ